MQFLVNAAQMKSYDRNTIENIGISSLVLMERAAVATVEEIRGRFPKISRRENGKERKISVLVVAGCGNNGGDSLAIGRILMEYGYEVSFVLIGNQEKCSRETAAQIQILGHMGVSIKSDLPAQIEERVDRKRKNWDIVIDGLFGIGLSREITGIFAQAVEYMNQSGAYIVSVDISSGIHTDTGVVMGTAVRADLTVTYGYEKLGQIFYPGAEYTGELVCKKIGISYREGLEKPAAFIYDRGDLTRLPVRKTDGNKGSFGKVFVIAGSEEMYGACQFAALGAYRTGAGLVRILTARSNRELLFSAVPEAIVDTYETEFPGEAIEAGLAWADCVVIGPGMGKEPLACQMMKYVWEQCRAPLIVDADGLNILAAWPESVSVKAGREIYFTPHMGEFSRLTKKSIKCCKEERIPTVKEYALTVGAIVVSKDARTVIGDSEGEIYINTSGDNGMATGGSGDVLAGILAGLVAQGMKGMEAACMAVYVHGLAGNAASGKKSAYSVMAGDLLEMLPEIFML